MGGVTRNGNPTLPGYQDRTAPPEPAPTWANDMLVVREHLELIYKTLMVLYGLVAVMGAAVILLVAGVL